jgi:hypothetical protein
MKRALESCSSDLLVEPGSAFLLEWRAGSRSEKHVAV